MDKFHSHMWHNPLPITPYTDPPAVHEARQQLYRHTPLLHIQLATTQFLRMFKPQYINSTMLQCIKSACTQMVSLTHPKPATYSL